MITGIALYVLSQLAICVWAARRTSSETDYLLAGRSLGPVAVGMSVFATWFAVEGIVATSGAVATDGIPGTLFDPIGLGLGIILFALLVAGPIRKGEHVMLSGYLGARFGPVTEALSGLVVCMSAIIWSSVQLLALAVLMVSLGDITLFQALAVATALVLAYTMLGGLLGDIVTDMVQGIVLILALGICLALVFSLAGGIETAIDGITMAQLVPEEQDPLSSLDMFFAAIGASLAGTELAGRTLGARSANVARNGALLGGGIYLAVGVMPVLFGLVGPQLGLDLPEGDGYLPALVEAVMPTWLRIVFIGALLSAVFSTVDSALLAVSAVATESAYRKFRPDMGPREGLFVARSATIGAGLIAFATAASGESIRSLAIQSASVGGCIVVPILFGVLSRSNGRWGAPASILVGLVILAWLDWVHGVPGAYLMALTGAGLAYVAAEFARNWES